MKRLLCLWLPDWPIQRRLAEIQRANQLEQTSQPEQANQANAAAPDSPAVPDNAVEDQLAATRPDAACLSTPPIILWHSDPRRGRVVASACPQAIASGIRLGMPVAQASDLAAMTSAIFEEHNRDADLQSLHKLAIDFQNLISPQTAIESLERFKWHGRHRHDPECIVSEIQGVTHLFDDEPQLLAAAARQLQTHGYHARLAIADTLGAAWALANTARSGNRPSTESPKLERPQYTFFIAPSGQTTEALKTLPPSALRLSPDIITTLDRLGVENVGTLLKLPREGLATRLGSGLCDRIAQATGERDEPILAIAAPSDHSATLEMEYPTDAMDLISDRLTKLIDEATSALHLLHRGVLRLQCHLQFTTSPPVVLESGLFAPTLDCSHLTNLMLGAIESQRLASKVASMAISVTQHAPLSSRQPSIFGPDFETASQDDWTRQSDAARLIDALSGRLGEDRVRGVRDGDDPLPESSIVDFPMTRHRRQSGKKAKPDHRRFGIHTMNGMPKSSDLGRRPLILLKPPLVITAIATNSNERTAGPANTFPSAFQIRGRNRQVARHWGPERIETRWWNGPLIRRDYFRVEMIDAERIWIYCDLAANDQRERWWMHGQFS